MTPEEAAEKLEIIELCTVKHWIYDHDDWDAYDDVFADQVSFMDRLVSPREMADALRGIKAGLLTQHLILGHRVELNGDTAICRAQSINIHFPADDVRDETLLAKGNEYRFDCVRTPAGWRIAGFGAKNLWSFGSDASHDAAAKLKAFADARA